MGTDQMSKETLENLSCLMDGELPSDAGRFLVRRVGADEGLSDTWQRYHLIRDCLRRPGEPVALSTFRIDEAQLELDPPSDQMSGSDAERGQADAGHRSRWLRPLAGGAIAASVAAAAITVVVNLAPAPGGALPESAAAPFASPNSAGLAPVSQPASFNAVDAASQRQLNRYLLRHNQAAGAVGPQGFMTLVPIVTAVPPQQIDGQINGEANGQANGLAGEPSAEVPLSADDSTP